MKKRKRGTREATKQTTAAPKDFAEYLATVPKPARAMLVKMRGAIRSAVPRDATETISYRIPVLSDKGVLVWYAAFADHCSLFPTAAVLEEFRKELASFSTSKGTIHFPMGKRYPRD